MLFKLYMKKIPQEKIKFDNLNIGCGWKKRENFVNIDKAKEVKPDFVVDIERGLPFPDDSFSYIYSSHCIEHVRPHYWKFLLNEIARVAKDGCILELNLPFDTPGARTNCDHYRTFGFMSFDPLLENSQRQYYCNLVLSKLSRNHYKLEKLFFYLFPFLKKNIYFKFKIVKK